jgi:hypothetical protein
VPDVKTDTFIREPAERDVPGRGRPPKAGTCGIEKAGGG